MNTSKAKNLFLSISLISLLFVVVLGPQTRHSQAQTQTEYQLLAPLPGVTTGAPEEAKTTATKYIEGLFMLLIGVSGALAVVMIIVGGIQYMSTDAVGGKSSAKDTIQNAVWGLALAAGAWIILASIDKQFVEFDLNIEPVDRIERSGTTATPIRSGGSRGAVSMEDCSDCVAIGVPHKPSGTNPDSSSCNSPTGTCVINRELNDRLKKLHSTNPLQVTESFPPTVTHQADCHYNGTCVDVTISNQDGQNIKNFIENAKKNNLRAVFEVNNVAQAENIRRVTGLSDRQVIVVNRVSPHFSVYLE